MFLYFPVDQVIPANQYIYSASLHLRYKDSSGENKFSPWDVFVYTPLNGFDELNTNWENQPGPFLGSMNHMSLNPSTSDMSINGLEFFVNLWHQGVYPNQGLGLSLQEDNIFFSFYSSEHALVNYRPYLRIKCGSGTPTPTPTATNTPTPTATPTAVPKTIDYIADNLEVTQGLQRYTNKVRLVEGKRTFVRFYVDVYDTAHTDGKTYPIDAKLRVYRENTLVGTLLPVNTLTGYLNIPYGWSNPYLDPNYLFMVSNNTFIFEIPSDLTNGTLRLVGNVNIDWKSPETNLINDDVETTVAFETVPQFGTKIFRVKWQEDDGTYHTTSYDNIQASLNFARQALPIPDIWAASSIYSYYVDYGRGVPHYNQLNQYLIDKWVWDYQNNNILFQEFPIVRYYALIDKNGEKVGGLANGIPGIVASGWTGWTSTFSHELAHTFGRHHATYCGADSGCANINIWGYKPCPDGYVEYPYNGGKIGPHEFSLEGFVYDNQNNFQIRSSNWYDLMSYCNPRWISDFTYHGIMNYLQPGLLSKDESVPDSGQVARSDNLLVSGAIDLNTGDLDLSPFFVIPDSTPLSSYDSGDFAIVLRDINGAELARYRFTPPVPILEQTCSLENTSSEPSKMLITELVPYDPLTARVDIEGPNGSGVIASATSGAAAPAVSVTSPNGGEIFAGDTITATWNANDADGDNLFFNVQYSPDNGTTWDMVAMNIQDTQVVIDRDNFHGSSQALIRVYASDGIHTSRDTSDGVFTIANSAPSVEITTPVTDTFAILGQTVAFSAFAVDRDLGVMSGDHLTWFSDIDGILGNGNQFSTAGLSGGIHKITVFVNDGDGGVAADSVQVTIYADSSQIPVEPDKMKVEPADIIIDTYDGPGTPFIQIYNANNNNPIAWSASSSESWLKLSSISGTSSEPILLDVNALDLPEGYYSATVTVTNMNNPSETYNVNVYLTVKFHNIYVPVVSMAP